MLKKINHTRSLLSLLPMEDNSLFHSFQLFQDLQLQDFIPLKTLHHHQRHWDARISAPWSRKRVKRLVRLKGPVSHFPGGTTSAAPPSSACLDRSATALANAAVFSLFPSPTAPYFVILATCFRHPARDASTPLAQNASAHSAATAA
uniref:Uncharacterized protein n=1 Tax=Arundo donax TaxID=35708 RepID=A0A0A9H4Q2_ARUDO